MTSSILLAIYLFFFSPILYANGSPSLGATNELLSKRQTGGPYSNVAVSSPLGYWPFVGSYYDISPNSRGPAVPNGANVSLTFEGNNGFVKIRNPGFLNIPAVNIRNISFAIDFNLRLPNTTITSRQILLSNWQYNYWQYQMVVEPSRYLTLSLRRNMVTDGSDPTQGLVDVTTSQALPLGTWVNVVFIYDTTRRKLSVFLNNTLSQSAVVRPELTDLTLHNATQSYVQLGNKADDSPVTGKLNADINQLQFSQLTLF